MTNSVLEDETENSEHKVQFSGKSFLHEKSVDVKKIQSRYEEYCESDSFVKPNIIFGFNLCIHESDLKVFECIWMKTVLALAKLETPFVMTAGTKDRARKDHKTLRSLSETPLNPTMCEQNPFASLVPERDFETEGLQHSNNYIIIYNKLSGGPKLNTCLAVA